jgi:hypothetical protein
LNSFFFFVLAPPKSKSSFSRSHFLTSISVNMSSSSAETIPPTPPMQLSADDVKCLKILHLHGVDLRKLERLIDQNVNQADAILAEYAKNLEGR